MQGLEYPSSKNTLVSFESSDDAGVYKISDDCAIVQTVDFITPVVDDPFLYGKIAAANSLSDVFAMGAKVHTALNMVAYDSCNVTKEMLNEILQGGLEKIKEAGGVLLGGHTIEDLEMKYGLSVTGLIHPNKILRNNTIKPGDKIILTKPLGTGVITTAIKADLAPKSAIDKAVFHMSFLNKTASEIAVDIGVNAMTDVTGFGLIGHLFEMTRENVSVQLDCNSIPIINEAYEMAELGMFPAGSYNNREHFSHYIEYNKKLILDDKIMLMFDAQTSGGLLISVAKDKAANLLDKIKLAGIEWAEIVGEVRESKTRKIILG
jgi:selenide, water dikinase